MNGVPVPLPNRLGRPVIWLATILVVLTRLTTGQAQSLTTSALPAPPAVEPASAASAEPAANLPASTVSPAIERFVRQSGRDLPQPTRNSTILVPPATSLRERADHPAFELPPAVTDPLGLNRTVGLAAVTQESRAASAPNPLDFDRQLNPAPFEPGDRRYPINLATALKLSDARPLVVAAAQASVWVAEADLTRAKALWVPNLTFAADYIRHDGGGPDFNKGIMTAPSVNFFEAGGALLQSVNFADVIFQPLQARQVVNSRQWDIQTAKNDALLQTADVYFQVHQYRGTYAGALYTVERGRQLVARIENLSKELLTKVEIERARNLLADLEQRAVLARQEWRVQSANLTQVLRLDPRAVLDPQESDHAQVTLVDPGRTLDDLMPVALANRPELSSRRSLVEAAGYAVRREKNRPLLPLIVLSGFQLPGNGTIQGGIFGLGYNSNLNQFRGRDDVSIQAVWQFEGLGIGNLARVKAQRGQQSRAIIDLRRTQDGVAADIIRALARVQSAASRVLQADRALRTGIISFNGQIEGLGQTRRFGDVLVLVFRPQETIYALDLLNTAFNEYFATVADYNRAQFELFHALGYPARELAQLRSTGPILPVDLDRPSYLPTVGTGAPTATR